tara:strand:- start:248 stop:517 length:270 start_codon:yes stop_codon:yes gene_type:complete
MDIDKFIKDKGLKVDCIVESDLDVKEYVQYELRDLIKEAVNEQLRLCIVSQQLELLGCEHNVITITDRDEGVCANCGVKMIRTWQPNCS